VSVAAPVGATVGVATATAKTVRVLKTTRIGRFTQRFRRYIRLDPPHHGKPPHWDGSIGKRFGDWIDYR